MSSRGEARWVQVSRSPHLVRPTSAWVTMTTLMRKGLGVTPDLLKSRASDVITAYKHSLSSSKNRDNPSPFDPAIAHMLGELSEEYTGEINEVAKKLNTLGKMVRKSNSNAMALHLFDNTLN